MSKKRFFALIATAALPFALLGQSSVHALGIAAQDARFPTVGENEYSSSHIISNYSVYQLTESQLSSTTAELIEYILDYPYLIELTLSNSSYIDAYSNLKCSFNGLAELETRTDATTALINKMAEKIESDEKYASLSALLLRILILNPVYWNQLSDDEILRFDQISKSCNIVVHSPNNSSSANTFASQVVAFTVDGYEYTPVLTKAYTTSGSQVPLYKALTDYSTENKSAIDQFIVDTYNVKLLSSATTMYNCHSYAWYYASTANSFWISDVEIFINDAHSNCSANPSVGAIAVYYNLNGQPVHSALVTSISGSTVTCKSKWGINGLYEHELQNVPSEYKCGSGVNVKYYTYTTYHTYTVTINNSATHTKHCTVCGYTSTEAHVENPKTGKCTTCGLKGPFEIIISSIRELSEECNDHS